MRKTIRQKHERVKARLPFKEIGVVILLLAVISTTYFYWHKSTREKEPTIEIQSQAESPFVKEGELTFISSANNLPIKIIDVAVADNEDEQEQGLMWKHSMVDSVGMLFLFKEEAQRSFWMKNTRISLDIIFVNAKNEIVAIHEYTQRYSELSVPSNTPAQFVIETNAGFCDQNGIKEGDKIRYQLLNYK